MKKLSFIIILFLLSYSVFSQTPGDALRYSYWNYAGSARYMGVSGSMGALGGDYSAVHSNPASIATYRRSELTFTLGVNSIGTSSNFADNVSDERRTKVNVSEGALIFASPKPTRWKTVNFGIGYHRLADFNQKFHYQGRTTGSIANYFLGLAQGFTPDQLSNYDDGLAYDVDMIYNPDANDLSYYENDLFSGDQTTKFQTVAASGSMGALNLTIGGNVNHKLYVGASANIPFVNYKLSKTYEETDGDNSILFFDGLQYQEGLTTSGVGFNLHLGAIYRINQIVRLGASIQTPTWLSLTDNFATALDFDITYNEGTANENSTTNSSASPENGFFEYRQKTPWRAMGNIGFIIKKIGFISAEVEWMDYSKNAYNYNSEFSTASDLQIEQETNNQINSLFQSAMNIKLGSEFVIAQKYRIRGGYALLGNPYTNNDGLFDSSQMSLGAGWRNDDIFFDIAYTKRWANQNYAPYIINGGPIVDNKLSTDNIVMTIGFKFGGKHEK